MESTPGLITSIVLTQLIGNIITVLYFAFFAHVWFRTPLSCWRIVIASLMLFGTHMITRFLIGTSLISQVITGVTVISCQLVLLLPMRGARFLLFFFTCNASEILLEFLANMAYMLLFPNAFGSIDFHGVIVPAAAPATLPVLFVLELIMYAIGILVCAWLRSGNRFKRVNDSSRRYLLRLILLIIVTIVFMVLASSVFIDVFVSVMNDGVHSGSWRSMLSRFAMAAIGIGTLGFYIWQSFQQYRLYVTNQSLLDRNTAYHRILYSTREFRHNIANLIYGFEGVILTGDITKIKDYYEDMARRCILNNNENADALNHIQDPAMTALLLRKIDTAAEWEIPFFITADDGFDFRSLPSTRLVEVLGNLLDNALEATRKADDPRVNLTFHSTDEYDELLLDNTYSPDADLSFLAGEPVSSKPGHQATGLVSVSKQMKAYPSICFNQYLRGRYVETSLCEYKH